MASGANPFTLHAHQARRLEKENNLNRLRGDPAPNKTQYHTWMNNTS